jgi:hypothetical protein
MNNKFFQYFTKLDADDNMKAFGVLVQIYHKDFTGNLLKTDKQSNRIELGSDSYTSEGNKILYETETVLQCYTEVSNYTGFNLTNKIENSYTVIVTQEKDVSFLDYFGRPSIYLDIIISRGFRFNHQTDNLVIQKPGQADGGAGKIVIPYGTNLTNLGNGGHSYTPAIPEDLNTYNVERRIFNDGDNVLFQYYDTCVAVPTKQLGSSNPNTPCLFEINKNDNTLQVRTTSFKKGNVYIGGEIVELYTKNCFSIFLPLNEIKSYIIDFSFTTNEIIFKNKTNSNYPSNKTVNK